MAVINLLCSDLFGKPLIPSPQLTLPCVILLLIALSDLYGSMDLASTLRVQLT